jgi:hypothetical protein
MIPDIKAVFTDSGGQAVTSSAASTYYIDGGAAGDALDDNAWFVCLVTTAFDTSSNTLQVALETDSDTGFATAKVVLLQTGAIATSSLVAGYKMIKARIPVGIKRYLRAYFTCSAGLTSGKVFAAIVSDVDALLG